MAPRLRALLQRGEVAGAAGHASELESVLAGDKPATPSNRCHGAPHEVTAG
jgi:hypothetical protein